MYVFEVKTCYHLLILPDMKAEQGRPKIELRFQQGDPNQSRWAETPSHLSL